MRKEKDKGHPPPPKIESSTYVLGTHWEYGKSGKGLQKYKWENYKENFVYASVLVPAQLS